jgi:hypothetical protein
MALVLIVEEHRRLSQIDTSWIALGPTTWPTRPCFVVLGVDRQLLIGRVIGDLGGGVGHKRTCDRELVSHPAQRLMRLG